MLSIHGVEFAYRSKKSLFRKRPKQVFPVLKGASLQIQSGELFGLVGPNGSGKTTLTKLILGVYDPDAGEILYLGKKRPSMNNSKWKSSVGWISGAATRLFTTINLKEHISLYKSLYPSFDSVWFDHMLEEFALHNKLTKSPTEISFGERIKFELGLTLAYKPIILILDEPTVGLDPMAIQQVRQMIRHYIGEQGACGILTSHNLKDITEVCHNGGFLNQGVIDKHFEPSRVDSSELEELYRVVFGSA